MLIRLPAGTYTIQAWHESDQRASTSSLEAGPFPAKGDVEAIPMKRNGTPILALVGAALLLATGPVSAHHAMVAEFSLNKPITMRGTLTKMEWVNPHGWIYIDAKGPDGRVESWKFETGSPFRMEKRGLKKTDFRVGSEVILSGFAAKDGTPTAAGMTITFLDREASFPAREATFVLGR